MEEVAVMVPILLQIAALAGVTLYFAAILYLLHKRTLALKYTLMWILFGILMAVIAVFPELLARFAGLVGISTPSNALFAAILFAILLILIALTSIISGLNDKNTRLVQSLALLEKRVRDLEKADENIPSDITG